MTGQEAFVEYQKAIRTYEEACQQLLKAYERIPGRDRLGIVNPDDVFKGDADYGFPFSDDDEAGEK